MSCQCWVNTLGRPAVPSQVETVMAVPFAPALSRLASRHLPLYWFLTMTLPIEDLLKDQFWFAPPVQSQTCVGASLAVVNGCSRHLLVLPAKVILKVLAAVPGTIMSLSAMSLSAAEASFILAPTA